MIAHTDRLNRARAFLGALLLATATATATVAAQAAPEYGPAAGKLVIVGGGALDGTGVLERFIALAGGPERKFVIVPTAGGNRRPDGTPIAYVEEQVIASWKARGLKNVRMLHTHDPRVADTEILRR